MPRRFNDNGPLENPQNLHFEGTHIGVVDIAVMNPGDLVSNGNFAQMIGVFGNGQYFWSAGTE